MPVVGLVIVSAVEVDFAAPGLDLFNCSMRHGIGEGVDQGFHQVSEPLSSRDLEKVARRVRGLRHSQVRDPAADQMPSLFAHLLPVFLPFLFVSQEGFADQLVRVGFHLFLVDQFEGSVEMLGQNAGIPDGLITSLSG